jgi:hypothetical protein
MKNANGSINVLPSSKHSAQLIMESYECEVVPRSGV